MFLFETQTSTYEEAKIVIFPCPLEKTTSYIKGTHRGPRKILDASLQVEFFDSEVKRDVSKLGIFTYDFFDYSSLSIKDCLIKTQKHVEKALRDLKFVVLLGGEHTISLSAIRAASSVFGVNNFSVLHLDAHSDMRDKYEDNEFNHACIIRRAHEFTTHTYSIGIRAQDETEHVYIQRNKDKFGVLYDHDILLKGFSFEEMTKYLPPNQKLYLTIDLDYFSPSEVPSVGTPVPGGRTYNETIQFLKKVFLNYDVFGFDVVELCPHDGNVRSDFFAAQLVYKLICYNFSKDVI